MELPRLAAYLDALPKGADSYSDVVVKASTFTAALKDKPVDASECDVPPPIEALLRQPPPVSAWVPEVHMIALFKIIGDCYFEGQEGIAGFEEWVYQQNRALFSGPLYKALFFFLRPESIFYGVSKRWGAFRRGTELTLLERGEGVARVELRYRPHLFDEEGLIAIGAALRAAADAAGAKEHRAEILDCKRSSAHLEITWTL